MSRTCKENCHAAGHFQICPMDLGKGISSFQAFAALKPDVENSAQGRWKLLHPNPLPYTSLPSQGPMVVLLGISVQQDTTAYSDIPGSCTQLLGDQVRLLTDLQRGSPVKASGSSQGHPNADVPGEVLLLVQHVPQRPVLTVLHDDGEAGAPICKAKPSCLVPPPGRGPQQGMCHQPALGMAGEGKGDISVTPLPFSSMQIPYMRRMFGDSNFFRV